MGSVPTLYSWADGEKPDFREMELRLSTVQRFLFNPPMVRLRRVSDQTISNTTQTAISWNFVEYESAENMWSSGQPTRITPSVPGWYVGTFGYCFAANATGYREVTLRRNGSSTDILLRTKNDAYTNATQTVTSRGNMFLFEANGTTDYIEVVVWQNSGGSLALVGDVLERQPDCNVRWFAKL